MAHIRVIGERPHGIPPLGPTDTETTMQNLATMSQAELIALVTAMQAQPARKLSMKVTEKGGLSIYGLGRFPVTLYRSQWDRLLDASTVTEIKAFIDINATLLAVKA